jgi:AcrR family transcriptional regulator
VILDAARALVLAGGPRAASVAAIAGASGAPAGTLYHRFGNRDGVVLAAWLRALERFQARALAAATGATCAETSAVWSETSTVASAKTSAGALETAAAMAVAAIGFARELSEDARLLLTIRPADLVDGPPGAEFREMLAAMNAPLAERLRELAVQLYGTSDPRAVDAVNRAVADLPYAVVRRHAYDDPLPDWLEADIATAARAMLQSYAEPGRRRDES